MAYIKNKFILFSTAAAFNTALTSEQINPNSIVFVKEAGKEFIWTQNTYFYGNFDSNNVQSVVDALTNATKLYPVNSVAVQAAIDAIGTGTAQTTAGKAITSITQTKGVVTATSGNVDAQYVTYTPVNTAETGDPVYNTTETTIQGVITEIYEDLDNLGETGTVAVYKNSAVVDTIAADGSDYVIKQGNRTVATINIAKDMVVDGGGVVTVVFKSSDNTLHEGTESGTDVTTAIMGANATPTAANAGKYIKLTLANSTDIIYLAVQDLYDDYTFTDSSEIDFTETNNTVTASLVTGSVAKSKLTTALQNEITSARTTLSELAQTSPATKHVLVTKQAGSGATPDNYVISENDIASASYVGTLPSSGTNATTVVGYVDEQVAAANTNNVWETGTGTHSAKLKGAGGTAGGNNSVSGGDHTTTTKNGEAAFGVYNTSSNGESDDSKTLFSVGIGESSAATANGIEVRADGSIWINLSSSYVKLQEVLSNEIDWYIAPNS